MRQPAQTHIAQGVCCWKNICQAHSAAHPTIHQYPGKISMSRLGAGAPQGEVMKQ